MTLRRGALLRSLGRTGVARLTDLAAELDVSIATVRRDVDALGRQGRLVRRHGAVELDTTPPSASGMVGAVGMMVSENRYLALIGHAARREAERRNLRFLTEQVETGAASRAATARLVRAGCVGLIYSPQWRTQAEIDEALPWLLDAGVPVVLGGREVHPGNPLYALDSVIADHAFGVWLAVDHLQRLGHTRITISLRDASTVAQQIGAAFATTVLRRGLADLGPPFVTPPAGLGPAEIGPAFAPLVQGLAERRATAVIVHTEDAAVPLAQELRRAGVRVPQDCSIVGYDDIIPPVADLALTTISPAKHQLGIEAVALLMRRHLRGRAGLDRPPTAHVRLLPELVVRRSTAPARS